MTGPAHLHLADGQEERSPEPPSGGPVPPLPRAQTPRPRPRGRVDGTGPFRPPLTPRERDVLSELARGATYADIGTALLVSENTVKMHVSSLYAKLGVSRRGEALAVARTHHLL